MDLIEKITQSQINPNIPEFRVGYTVNVGYLIKEKKKGGETQRVQNFEGIVIARKGSGSTETFTVRSMKYGVGVERTFPVNCPNIKSLTVIKKGKVSRAKLYFLRDRKGKYSIKEQR